ncbi:MAG: hypothetical protein ACOVLB_08140 [Candidatus Nanopelagicus sp.]
MYTYQLCPNNYDGTPSKYVKRLPDQVFIPNDIENTDWQAYQAWLAEGNTTLPPEGN